MSALLQQGCFGPEALSVASEAFSRAWTFIERDPILASCEREKLQSELAREILEAVQTEERDLLQITNRAIRRVRERMLVPEKSSRASLRGVNAEHQRFREAPTFEPAP